VRLGSVRLKAACKTLMNLPQMAVRNESEANFTTTTSFVEGDILLTVHLTGEGNNDGSNRASPVRNQL